MDDPAAVVSRFCAAWSDFDLDALMAFFTDDAVYHNIPLEPVVGPEAIRATIDGFTAGVDGVEFEVLRIAANGEFVLTERIDRFSTAGRTITLPVMGAFDVRDGKIAAWRDYFDLQQFLTQMPSTE